MRFKLGKKPARPGAVKLRLSTYIDLSRLPTPPSIFGHDKLVSAWEMLGNDSAGDCVWAGAAHETMMWNMERGVTVPFDTTCVLSDYSAVTGYVPGDSSTDNGTDMQTAAKYRQNTGIVDANGNRHKIGAYLAIRPGNLNEHLVAAYLFGAVGMGINFPDSAMNQFDAGQPWTVVPGANIEGGHYIPFVANNAGMITCVTWAQEQLLDDNFFHTYNDESIVYLSEEMLSGGKSLEGFDLQQLQHDLTQLRRVH